MEERATEVASLRQILRIRLGIFPSGTMGRFPSQATRLGESAASDLLHAVFPAPVSHRKYACSSTFTFLCPPFL